MPTSNTDGLTPPRMITSPRPEFEADQRLWQGIATIERSATGRLWAAWYTGGRGEMPGNHVVLAASDDDGKTWQDPVLVVVPETGCRNYDPCLWIDPQGKLWLFFAQSGEYRYFDGRAGVWAITSTDHGQSVATWSPPIRIFHGIMLQKPLVSRYGDWLFPVSIWSLPSRKTNNQIKLEVEPYAGAGVLASSDQGKTWQWRGSVQMPEASFDEHALIERSDDSLWLLARTSRGIYESESTDGGKTWSPACDAGLSGARSKFYIRRLGSGRLLLVKHAKDEGRSHLTAVLSKDDGRTWEGGLLLDEQSSISYPDGCQSQDGRIYVCYDHERGDMRHAPSPERIEQQQKHEREILFATFTEDDVLAGRCLGEQSRLQQTISRLGPSNKAFLIDQYLHDGGLAWDNDQLLP